MSLSSKNTRKVLVGLVFFMSAFSLNPGYSDNTQCLVKNVKTLLDSVFTLEPLTYSCNAQRSDKSVGIRKYYVFALEPLNATLRSDNVLTNVDISIEIIAYGDITSIFNKQKEHIKSKFIRRLSRLDSKRLLNDLKEGFLSKDLERDANKSMGTTFSENRVVRVNVTSMNFRYPSLAASLATECCDKPADCNSLVSDAQTSIKPLTKDSRFDATPIGTATLNLERISLGSFTAPTAQFPSKTISIEAKILCSKDIVRQVIENRGKLKYATIKHLLKYPPSLIMESVIDGSLQKHLRRVYDNELNTINSGHSDESPIYEVYFPIFHMDYPQNEPSTSQDKEIYLIEYKR